MKRTIDNKKVINTLNALRSAWIDSPLGSMFAISDKEGLYLLEFAERTGLEKSIAKLKAEVMPGRTNHIDSVERELAEYFSGNLKEFKTPIHLLGSPFQKTVWQELMRIPYGETRSYLAQAKAIDRPKSYRAVANANGANKIAIIIPCHRIINNNGNLGGYGGGVMRKKWLLDHERRD